MRYVTHDEIVPIVPGARRNRQRFSIRQPEGRRQEEKYLEYKILQNPIDLPWSTSLNPVRRASRRERIPLGHRRRHHLPPAPFPSPSKRNETKRIRPRARTHAHVSSTAARFLDADVGLGARIDMPTVKRSAYFRIASGRENTAKCPQHDAARSARWNLSRVHNSVINKARNCRAMLAGGLLPWRILFSLAPPFAFALASEELTRTDLIITIRCERSKATSARTQVYLCHFYFIQVTD